MKVMTLNTHSYIESQPLEKLAQIATYIKEENPDIVALQEINQLITSKEIEGDDYFCPLANQVPLHEDNFAYLLVSRLRELGLNYYWSYSYTHIGYDTYQEGLALLSKEKLISTEQVTSNPSYVGKLTRKILVGQTSQATFVVGHYSWAGKSGFDYEWAKTKAALKGQKQPLVIMGDFNNPPESSAHQQIREANLGLVDSFQVAAKRYGEHTVVKAIDGWQDNEGQLRIDYVYLSDTFKVSKYQVIFDGQTSPQVSDHFGILVEIE